jgi:hypothetical protein
MYRVTVLRPAALMQRPGCEPESMQREKLYQLNVFSHVLGRQVHEIAQFLGRSKNG